MTMRRTAEKFDDDEGHPAAGGKVEFEKKGVLQLAERERIYWLIKTQHTTGFRFRNVNFYTF